MSVKRILDKYNSFSLNKKAVIWFTLATIIQNGISFVVTPIYTRCLSGTEYGVYSIFQSWQQIFAIISVVALDRCITVGFMKFSKERIQFLSSIQTLMTILVLIWSLFVIIFPSFFVGVIGLPIYMIVTMLIVSLMNNTLANWSWYQRYEYNYKLLTFVTVGSTIFVQLVACLSIWLVPVSNKGNLLVMSTSFSRLLVYGIIYIIVLKNGKKIYEKKYWDFGLKYSVAIVPHALSQIILNSSDRIIIDKLYGKEETAFYSVTYSAAMILNTIVSSVSSSLQPWYFEKIKEKDFKSISRVTNNVLIFSACLSICVSLFAPEVISIMAPSSYKAAIWVFPSIAASVYFNSMYFYFANFESYFEKPYFFSIATSIGAIVNIVLNILLIPFFGFVAAGYTTLACYILFSIMHYYFMTRISKEFLNDAKIYNLKFIVALSITVLILSIGVTLLYKNFVLRYIIIILIIIISFIYRKKIMNILNILKNIRNS